MVANLNNVILQALNLLPDDRIYLAEGLLESVDNFPDPEIEEHWRDLAIKRLAEHESSDVSGIPEAWVHRKIWENLSEDGLPPGSWP